ncbi:MAG: hypothetical protein HQM02_02690 [Magnetococcales bacterium]|nr:hypothetical protein [Magnetococcales bacterium]
MTIVILSIIAVVGAVSMSSGFNAYLTAQAIEPMANNGRLALERLRKELRNAQTCTGITQPGGNGTIRFTNDQGRVVLVTQEGNPGNAIYMNFDGSPDQWMLAPNVEAGSLQFQRSNCSVDVNSQPLSPGLVTIAFTMATPTTDGGVVRLPFRTAVFVRSAPL